MGSAKNPHERMQAYVAKYRELTAKLSATGFIWPGHIHRSFLTCGKTNCACYKDPQARHGPYAYWTTKVRKKTVSRLLSSEEADLLEEWIENRRKLEAIVGQMKGLSKKAVNVAMTLRKQEKGD